ncbi:hypothetical protein TRFO_07432 [Tritrichomonas foetus]|uniref:Uncharacterized protein n=1 Tax=Tritrichomonas foetus TaxID=1144522 RepID=A0A1J4JX50_9EUKA|nr:hypothetical protein TRFO_07432 [Tritrichomonas foetus]|eukprot:OHT01853.1 hypothetical protein TRFO_07432 [Tritrichomonas foetus]
MLIKTAYVIHLLQKAGINYHSGDFIENFLYSLFLTKMKQSYLSNKAHRYAVFCPPHIMSMINFSQNHYYGGWMNHSVQSVSYPQHIPLNGNAAICNPDNTNSSLQNEHDVDMHVNEESNKKVTFPLLCPEENLCWERTPMQDYQFDFSKPPLLLEIYQRQPSA